MDSERRCIICRRPHRNAPWGACREHWLEGHGMLYGDCRCEPCLRHRVDYLNGAMAQPTPRGGFGELLAHVKAQLLEEGRRDAR